MSRRKRFIESGSCYELCFRAREGLPFPALKLIDLLLRSAIARANRGNGPYRQRVTISHMIWMGNHTHMIVRAFDAKDLRNFMMETQRKITEYIKRLTGKRYLLLWEGDAQVSKILELENAVNRVAYLYLNPARASLVDSIHRYPGLSTWQQFLSAAPTLDALIATKSPWIRYTMVKPLSSSRLSEEEDSELTASLTEDSPFHHLLQIRPNDWMAAFGVNSSEEIQQINKLIREKIEAQEENYSQERKKKGHGVIGEDSLRRQRIMAPHTPEKKNPRVFVLSSNRANRVQYIKHVKDLFEKCTELYHKACSGQVVVWPPGVFPPPLIPVANALP